MSLSELIPLGVDNIVHMKRALDIKSKRTEAQLEKIRDEYNAYTVALTLLSYSLQPGDIVTYTGRRLRLLDDYKDEKVLAQEVYRDDTLGEIIELRDYHLSRCRKWIPPTGPTSPQQDLEFNQAISNLATMP